MQAVLRIHDGPRIHASDLWIRMRIQKTNFLKLFFYILLFEGTLTSVFKGKKSKRSHKTAEIKVFLTICAE